jgi:hypothetical protein
VTAFPTLFETMNPMRVESPSPRWAT